MSRAPLRVAVLGAGTVGREVVRGADRARRRSSRRTTAPRSSSPGSPFATSTGHGPRGLPADLLTDGPAHLVAAPDTDVVVELMGGDEPAHTLIAAALAAGKSVVTANKHVIAHHGRSSRRSPGGPARRSASRRPSAAGSRSSARSQPSSRRTGSRPSAASSTARRTTS